MLTIQPVAVTGRPALNIQLEVLEFVAKYQALTNGKTPSARLIAHALKPRVSTSHRKVLDTLREMDDFGWISRVDVKGVSVREIHITPEGRAVLEAFHSVPQKEEGSEGGAPE